MLRQDVLHSKIVTIVKSDRQCEMSGALTSRFIFLRLITQKKYSTNSVVELMIICEKLLKQKSRL